MAPTGPALDALIKRLQTIATGQERQPLDALDTRLADRRFRVLVVGEAKRGKSTLINALLGRVLLPTGVTPVTALPTIVRHGRHDRLDVHYLNQRVEERALAELPDLVTETRNPDNRLGIAEIVVHTPAQLLADNIDNNGDGDVDGDIDLVDTPGVGSVFARSAAAATQALDTMDAAVFVLSADPPISDSERGFLAAVRDRSIALFCVLNKIDNVSDGERAEVLDFTGRIVADVLGHPVKVYPVSARAALAAEQRGDETAMDASGLPELRAELGGYLRTRRADDLIASVAGHAGRVAARMLDQALLTRRATELSTAHADDLISRFSEQLTALDDYRRDASDVAKAAVSRLLTDLNDAVTWETLELTSSVRAAVAAHVDAQPAVAAAQLEDECRAYAVELTRAAVERWRTGRETAIVDGLAAVDARLAAALDRQVGAVREAARELLGVDLSIPTATGRLLPDVAVSYAFREEIGTTVQWSGVIRRHLPGRWGRHAVRAHLLDELDLLVGKQIGRIRSALQDALRPATAALIRAIEVRYTEATGGLVSALSAARDLANSPDAAAGMRELDDRIAVLRELATALAGIAAPRHAAERPVKGAA